MRGHTRWMCAVLGVIVTAVLPGRAADSELPNETEKVAAELANPLSPVTTLSGQFRAELGNGPDDDVNVQARLQPSFFRPFADRSALLLRTIMPVLFKNWPASADGLGDVTLVPYYVPNVMQRTFMGYGAALGIPTAQMDTLGSGQWTAGPAMIVAQTGMPFTYGGLVQHIWSYAGDRDRVDVSVTTLQPFVTYLLGGGWALSVNMEASYNWNVDPAPWTVPVAAGLSKVVTICGKFVNLGVSGVNYVEKPDYAPDWELRANVTYVFR